jgi:hypothetical protein
MAERRRERRETVDLGKVLELARDMGHGMRCGECEPCAMRGRLGELSRTMPTIMDLLSGYAEEVMALSQRVREAGPHPEGSPA